MIGHASPKLEYGSQPPPSYNAQQQNLTAGAHSPSREAKRLFTEESLGAGRSILSHKTKRRPRSNAVFPPRTLFPNELPNLSLATTAIAMRLGALPSSLLLLVAAQVSAEQQQQQIERQPTLIRKMPLDSAEKLFDSYLAFAPLPETPPGRIAPRAFLNSHEAVLLAANSSALLSFRPAFRPSPSTASDVSDDDYAGWVLFRRAAAALAALQSRQWGCPAGTSSCAGIGYPYSCCHTGETCYKITDTGLGPVGCCPASATCGGTISTCGAGDLACPSSLGGGCCIAGYSCQGVGCTSPRGEKHMCVLCVY